MDDSPDAQRPPDWRMLFKYVKNKNDEAEMKAVGYVYLFMHACMYVCMYACMYLPIYLCSLCVCVCVCMYACMHACIYKCVRGFLPEYGGNVGFVESPYMGL